MLIGTYSKRPLDEIDLVTRKYFFKPIIPDDPNSIHVCEVKEKTHIDRLLSLTESFFKMDKDADPYAMPEREATKAIVSERQTAADQVLKMSLRGLREAMNPNRPQTQFTADDLRQARQIEMGKPPNERRDPVIAVIEQFLSGIELNERRALNVQWGDKTSMNEASQRQVGA